MGEIIQLSNFSNMSKKQNNSSKNSENSLSLQTDYLTISVFGFFQKLFSEPNLETMYNQAMVRFENLMKNGYIIPNYCYEFDLDLWENHIVPNQSSQNQNLEIKLLDDGFHSLMGIQHMYSKYLQNPQIIEKFNLMDEISNQELFDNICYHQIEDYFRYLSNQKTKFSYLKKLALLNSKSLSEDLKFKLIYSNQLKFKPAIFDYQTQSFELQNGFIGFDKTKIS